MGQSAQQFAIRYQNEVKPHVNDAVLDQKIQNRIQYAIDREAENIAAKNLSSFTASSTNPTPPPLPPIKTNPKPGDGEDVINVDGIENEIVKVFVIELEAFIDSLFE